MSVDVEVPRVFGDTPRAAGGVQGKASGFSRVEWGRPVLEITGSSMIAAILRPANLPLAMLHSYVPGPPAWGGVGHGNPLLGVLGQTQGGKRSEFSLQSHTALPPLGPTSGRCPALVPAPQAMAGWTQQLRSGREPVLWLHPWPESKLEGRCFAV